MEPQRTSKNGEIAKKVGPGALSGSLCERVVEKEHILECLGPQKHGFRVRGASISHFSQDLIF